MTAGQIERAAFTAWAATLDDRSARAALAARLRVRAERARERRRIQRARMKAVRG